MKGARYVMAFDSDSEILFYFNCDSAVSGQPPGKGSGIVTIPSIFSAVDGKVGNGLQKTITTDSTGISIPAAGNVNTAVGTLGFWVYFSEAGVSGAEHISFINSSGTNVLVVAYNSSGPSLLFKYDGSAYQWSPNPVTLNTWVFVEVAWSIALAQLSMRINNGSWGYKMVTMTEPTIATLRLMGYKGVQIIDNVFISSVYKKDLYAYALLTDLIPAAAAGPVYLNQYRQRRKY
jgi:hypothetical protein